MKMNIKQREKILLIITLVVACFVILYQLGFSKLYDQLARTSSELEQQKKIFTDYLLQFNRKAEIEQAYAEIESQFPPASPDKKPAQQFSEDVDALCRQLGFYAPNIEPPKDELIPEVNDYKFITLVVHVEGPMSDIANLLKGFHRKALLINKLTLTAARDQDRISATITAARIAKLTPEDMELLKKRSTTRTSRTSSSPQPRFRVK